MSCKRSFCTAALATALLPTAVVTAQCDPVTQPGSSVTTPPTNPTPVPPSLLRSLQNNVSAPADIVGIEQDLLRNAPLATNTFMVPLEPLPIDKYISEQIRTGALPEDIGLNDLPNVDVLVRSFTTDDSGNISYLTANIAHKHEQVIVQQDYEQFHTVLLLSDMTGQSRYARVGIALRVEADVETFSNNVNLGSLFALGVAAANNQIRGSLSVHIIGFVGHDITNLLPLPASISPDSISSALQAIATIKSRIYDNVLLTKSQRAAAAIAAPSLSDQNAVDNTEVVTPELIAIQHLPSDDPSTPAKK